MNRGKDRFWTKSSEKVPWQMKELRSMSLSALGLYFLLSHGPGNGQTRAGLTVGIYIDMIGGIAAWLQNSHDEIESNMAELEALGLAKCDRENGVTILPDQIRPVENASHFTRFIDMVLHKVPDCELVTEYIRSVVDRTRGAAAATWKVDRENLEELIADLERARPELDLIDPFENL